MMQGTIAPHKPSTSHLVALGLGVIGTLAYLGSLAYSLTTLNASLLFHAKGQWSSFCFWLRQCASGGNDAVQRKCSTRSVPLETAPTVSSDKILGTMPVPASQRKRAVGGTGFEAHRALLVDAARSAHRASSQLPELRAEYPTGTDLDRWLANLRQFSYLMREVDMVEEKLLEAAEFLARPSVQNVVLDTKICRLALPLAEGVRSKPLMLQWTLCLQRGSSESAARRLLQCLPVLAPRILSFLMNASQSAELVLIKPGLRAELLMAAERLTSCSSADMPDDLALPGFEERLSREIIQGSFEGLSERRSFRQRTEARRR